MLQEIHVDIALDGAVKIDAIGFSGSDCEQATAFLEEALGQVTQKRRKPEYYQQNTHKQAQRLGNGRR